MNFKDQKFMNKRFALLFVLVTCLTNSVYAQIQVFPPPSPNFEERIRTAVDTLMIIDTHEHLMNEKQSAELQGDFGCLFNNYQFSDLISSGAEESIEALERIMRSTTLSPDEKWAIIDAHWDDVKTTGYGRMVNIASRDLFGIPELNQDTYLPLSKKIKKLREGPDYYEYILKHKAKIDLSILIGFNDTPAKQDPRYFKSLFWHDNLFLVDEYQQIESICKNADLPVAKSLQEYEAVIKKIVRKQLDVNSVLGLKIMMAYRRTLQCDDVPQKVAEVLYQKLRASPSKKFTFKEIKPLQDYLLFYMFSLCDTFQLPVQIHTGMQTFNQNHIGYTNPIGLTEAFLKFPRVRFALLHASYPYGGELAALAKKFPNIFIDMTWAALISPSYTIRYIQEYITTVPVNKIVAFGGDCHTPEGVYAASVIARETVSNALIPMVRSGYLSESEAITIAKKILRTNAISFYGLDRFLD